MPLQFDNEEHKRRVLQLKGFNPDQYDVDVNSGNIIPHQQIAAPLPQLAPKPITQETEQPKVSLGRSAAIGAATGVLPAAGGLAAMGALQTPILGISAATGPAAPLTYAGLNIAAAIGGGSLVNWAQNKLMPNSMAQSVAEAQQANPGMFSLGNIIGQLPVMTANPRGVVEAVKTGGKVVNNLIRPGVQPLPISLAEKANLANVGVGAALPAGISGVNAVLGNEEVNPKTLALEMAGGALLNKPTQLGSKLLRTPHGSGDIKPNISPEQQRNLESSTTPEKPDLKTYGKALELAENQRLISEGKIPEGFKVEIQIKPPEFNPKKSIEDKILSPELRKVNAKGQPKMELPESGILRKLKIKQDVVYPFKSAEESAAEMFNRENPAVRARDRLEFGGENPQGENYNKTGPESLGLPANKTPEQIASERESNYILYRDLIKSGKLDDAMSFSKKLGESYYFGRRYTAEKASGKPEKFDPITEGKLTAAEQQLLAARRKNFQGLSDTDTQLTAEKRLRAETEKAGNIQKLNTTKKYWDEFRKIFEPLRGIKAELDSKLKNPETGKAVRGQIDSVRQGLKDYSVKINPNLATPDTLGHEFLHGFITDLKTSGDKNQRAAVDNLLKVISESPEFKADNEIRVRAGKKPLDAEEFLTETSGYELFNKLVNLDNLRGTYKESWRNFVGQVKAKLGKSSVEDVQRYVANRFIDDPSIAETTVITQQNNGQRDTERDNVEDTEDSGESETSGQGQDSSIETDQLKKDKSSKQVTQESDGVTKSDFEQYQEIQRKFKELMSQGKGMGDTEIQALWKENEVIKNRHGGMPPKPDDQGGEGKKFQDVDDSRDTFELSLLKELRTPKPFGLTPDSEGKLAGNYVADKLPKVLPKLEHDILKESGLEKFLRYGKHTPAEIENWIKENGPKVQTHVYGMEGKVSEAKREYDRMTHELDSMGTHEKNAVRAYLDSLPERKRYNENYLKQVGGDKLKQWVDKYQQQGEIVKAEPHDTSPRATSAYEGVSAFDTKKPMPKWTTSKEGKNVQQIHVTVGGKVLFEGDLNHGGSHSRPDNSIGHVAIQYVTGPKGEQIAFIGEAQSDWGQAQRKTYNEMVKRGATPEEARQRINEGRAYAGVVPPEQHPLLRDYNRLILKAAIDQARKEGATHIVVSDAESAMMTEGHDLVGPAMIEATPKNQKVAQEVIENKNEPNSIWSNLDSYNRQRIQKLAEGSTQHFDEIKPYLGDIGFDVTRVVSQEPGMRLNYDSILPKIAEELTGSKGERVSLGEHKNAFEAKTSIGGGLATRRPWDGPESAVKQPRSNLIFKNPDGSPKTDVSGLMYPIDSVSYKLSTEPFSLTGRKFQEAEEVQATTPEAIRANINSTIEAPAFKKSGLIRQNLSELKTRLPIFGSDLDKLSSRQGESGNYIAPAIKEALAKTDEFEGRWFNPSLENIKSLKYSDQQLLVDTLRAEHRQGKSLRDTLPTEELKKSYDIQRELLKDKQQNQIEANQPVKEYVRGKNGGFSVVPRLPKINPFYFPDIAGAKQLDIILNYEGSEAFNKLKSDFISHIKNQYKFDDKVANEFFEDYRASFSRNAEATSRFGAVRKAEGVGLPDSWLEADPAVTLRRYWRRVARDRAWFDAVEKDPNNLYILNQNKDAWDRDVVPTKEGLGKIRSSQLLSDILENVHGMATKTNPKLDSLVRIANNLILGPLTGVNDLLSVLPLASKFAPSITNLPRVYTEAVSSIKNGIKNAKAQGRIKEKISDVEDIWMPSTENVEKLRQIGDGIAKLSGREKLEEWSRGLAQAAGESLIRIHKNSNSPKSIEFLKGLANKEDYTKMSDSQLAARIVDLTQGTYDVRGLPSWAINSQVAPFFRMMKWNIEQLNNLHKHVIIPASNGNLTPLILSLTAGAVGGYIAKETRELLSGKKTHYPSLSEIANADGDKLKPATYAVAAAISYSGVLGLLGEVFKSIGDISYKNKPNAPSFPTMEVAADFVDNITDAIQAIGQEGEDPLLVLPQLTKNLFTNNIQVGRMLLNRFGDIDDQQQRRDLRVFKQLTGRDYSPQSVPDNTNQFVGLKNKEVKKAETPAELFRATKNRVGEIISENKNDPRRLSTELQKLKTGGVTTMPSLQNSPGDFSEYYKYLVKQYGKEEADRRVSKYSKQLSLNKTRRALIPNLN